MNTWGLRIQLVSVDPTFDFAEEELWEEGEVAYSFAAADHQPIEWMILVQLKLDSVRIELEKESCPHQSTCLDGRLVQDQSESSEEEVEIWIEL